ncbi:MAG: EamA family transporter RarD [Alphaproteobacteria bacterium]
MDIQAAGERRAALAAAVGSNLIWGFLPLAMQAIAKSGPGPWEILSQRIIWGAVTAGIFVLVARHGDQVRRALTNPRTLGWLALSSLLVAINWITFIWAATHGRVTESSLGYYILPLVSMAAGAVVFRERLSPFVLGAIALAALGVAVQAMALGRLPWVSLAVSIPFAGYGIVRKRVAVDAQAGLFVECLVLLVPALAVAAWLGAHGAGHFLMTPRATAWLIASGPLTAVPLALFAWATRRLPLTAMGFLQFFSPTVSFLLGVSQGEPFHPLNQLAFGLIWAGVALFLAGAVRSARMAHLAAEAAQRPE